ncbi:glycerol uptake operon antiterminator [Sporobacter termitidis DSM 10068]|uniref:Glycerol uptake operon antiterminator n=1 Tax=Sporobacter termitidis DSM 10068 TaxID=1123282 RepID=A0A1M5XBJ3_9FIRM|nr:glycerol uptake operon antiterminator [Sporobacter termitidis DSM 10068]
MASDVGSVIYMKAEINTVVSNTFKSLCRMKPVFLHADLLKGLSGDKEALRFIKKHIEPYGIVSTKSNIIKAAKREGLATIQRVFLIDTQSFHNSLDAITENEPDGIEIMPAIAPSIVKKYKEHFSIPIILGGLISDSSQIEAAFDQGADAVSFSKSDLWSYKPGAGSKNPV